MVGLLDAWDVAPLGLDSSVLALLGGLLIALVVVLLIVYIYSALALMAIAKRTKTKNAWLAWIPIANIYLMTQIGGLHPAWTLAILLAFIPFIGGVAFAAVAAYLWWNIAEKCKKPGWWGILMLIPIVNFVLMGILAWGKK